MPASSSVSSSKASGGESGGSATSSGKSSNRFQAGLGSQLGGACKQALLLARVCSLPYDTDLLEQTAFTVELSVSVEPAAADCNTSLPPSTSFSKLYGRCTISRLARRLAANKSPGTSAKLLSSSTCAPRDLIPRLNNGVASDAFTTDVVSSASRTKATLGVAALATTLVPVHPARPRVQQRGRAG